MGSLRKPALSITHPLLQLVAILLLLALLVLMTGMRRRCWWAGCAMMQLPRAHVDALLLLALACLAPFLLMFRLMSFLMLLMQ